MTYPLHTMNERGFTMIEFIVIMSIFAIMSSVALFNFRGFNNTVASNNLAYDIALELKTAQTLGSSSIDDFDSTIESNDREFMTVYFDEEGGSFTNTIQVFREGIGPYGQFDSAVGDTIFRDSTLAGGVIQSIELVDSAGNARSFTDAVAISFRRPSTEPVIISRSLCDEVAIPSPPKPLVSGTNIAGKVCSGIVHITIASSDEVPLLRTIIIEPTGQIHVEG